jgi:hypothetical protein
MPKRRTKKQRDAAERKRKQRRDSKRRVEMAKVLSALGVLREFRQQPAGARNRLSRLRYPPPEIVLDCDAKREAEARKIEEYVSGILEQEFIVFEGSGAVVTLLDFFCIGVPLWHFFSAAKLKPTGVEPADQFVALMCRATTEHISRNLEQALAALAARVENALVKYSRIDRKLFWITLDIPREEDPDPESWFKVTVHVHRAKAERREIDGIPKRLYRCGAGFGIGIDWVSWTAEDLGFTGPEKALPVLIDGGHALRNLRERVAVAPDSGAVEDCIWASLQSPKATRIEGREEFLVEYHLGEYKLGYFVFKTLGDMYVAKTFLFLTMDGTPEGEKLWSRLRLTKKDKQYTGLDRLSTFVLSDMKDDPELVAVFEECGCGHLFEMDEGELSERKRCETAADVRSYLGDQLGRALAEIRERATSDRSA